MLPIEVNVGWDQEHGAGRIEIQPKHGRLSEIDWPVLESPKYQEALAAQKDLLSIGKAPYRASSIRCFTNAQQVFLGSEGFLILR